MRRSTALTLLVAASFGGCGPSSPEREPSPLPDIGRHVLLLHLDGYHPELVRSLLVSGRLPHLARLAERGRISYDVATVDKSETMKIVQSYLTSQLDTRVTGWWQFDRERFRFANYWLDPAEVLNFALGLEFPLSPTLQDFLAAEDRELVAGMSLVRRGVPFANYGRAYLEGIAAVSNHTYHEQAVATTDSFLAVHERLASEARSTPALSTLVLAAADEFSHLRGVTSDDLEDEACVDRDSDVDEAIFRKLDDDDWPEELEDRYFTRVERTVTGGSERICFEIPALDGRRFERLYVLSMLLLDMELGRVIEQFRETRDELGVSLYDRTLFVLFGDHGMVDTPNGMAFLDELNRRLALESGSEGTAVELDAQLGIDHESLPLRLREPDRFPEWQTESERALTGASRQWAQGFVSELRELLRHNLHESYWFLFFLRSIFIDPRLQDDLAPVEADAERTLRRLYLAGVPEYVQSEARANRAYFDRHVRLVYGGGARNNAELFLPSCDGDGGCDWSRRPSLAEIAAFRGGSRSETTLLQALMDDPGTGLVFVRENNEAFAAGDPLPETSAIRVMDRDGRRGRITVSRDDEAGELVFHYRADAEAGDPLYYEAWSMGEGSYGTYNEWNDRTLGERYVNAVAGMGAYLYSSNPSIGDVVVLHADRWNFGDNAAGHGGVHRGEKRTFALVSGPGVGPGPLLARARFESDGQGGVSEADPGRTHQPTLLDIAPTALRYLGYDPSELEAFAGDGFELYLDEWIASQRGEILAGIDTMRTLEDAREEAGVPQLSLDTARPRIARLLEFVGARRRETLSRLRARRLLGNEWILSENGSAPAR